MQGHTLGREITRKTEGEMSTSKVRYLLDSLQARWEVEKALQALIRKFPSLCVGISRIRSNKLFKLGHLVDKAR